MTLHLFIINFSKLFGPWYKILVPWPEIEPVTLQWKHGVLTTGLLGKSLHLFTYCFSTSYFLPLELFRSMLEALILCREAVFLSFPSYQAVFRCFPKTQLGSSLTRMIQGSVPGLYKGWGICRHSAGGWRGPGLGWGALCTSATLENGFHTSQSPRCWSEPWLPVRAGSFIQPLLSSGSLAHVPSKCEVTLVPSAGKRRPPDFSAYYQNCSPAPTSPHCCCLQLYLCLHGCVCYMSACLCLKFF